MRTPLSPISIVALAVFCGASIDAAVKFLAAEIDVVTLMGWRFFFGAWLMMVAFIYSKKPKPTWEAIRFHALRGLLQTTAALTFFWSLTQLALAEATVIGFTAALMIAPIALVILGEKLSPLASIAAVAGFCGAILAVSGSTEGAPEDGNRLLGAIVCLIAALCYAFVLVLMRLRSQTEDALTIVTYTNVFPALFLFPYLIATDPLPNADVLPVYIGLAVAGTLVWWLMTTGYANAEAQKLAPLEYTALIWASLYGWIFFEEVPSWQLWIGAAIIITACMIIAFETRFRTRREARLPASDIPE